MPAIILIAHNIRSCHNVGSILRTAEGLGIGTVYFTGYTPYPARADDTRLPHLARKIHRRIAKTALGAEESQPWAAAPDIIPVIERLSSEGYLIAALEQSSSSVPLPRYRIPPKIALIVGREVEGLERDVLERCGVHLEIPMSGRKESFNVSAAAAMAMYHCAFGPRS